MSSQCNTVTKTNVALNYIRRRQIRQTIDIILHLYGIIDIITRISCPILRYTPQGWKVSGKNRRFTKSAI